MAVIKSSIKIQNLYINFHLPTPIHLQQDYVNYMIFNLFLSLVFPFGNMKHVTCSYFYRFHLQLSTSPKILVSNKDKLKQSFTKANTPDVYTFILFVYFLNTACRQCSDWAGYTPVEC